MKVRTMYILAAIVVATVFIGQIMIYVVNPYDTKANSWIDGDKIGYEIHTNTSSEYNAVLFETSVSLPDKVMVYEDSRYAHQSTVDVRSVISIFCSELSSRNVDCLVVDADELRERIECDLSNGKADMRLVMPTGVMPDTIYQGESDDLILQWLKMGGVLYWTGYQIGRCYSSFQEMHVRNDDYATDFLGVSEENLRKEDSSLYATETAVNYDMGLTLSIMYNDSTFGIRTDNLSDYKSIGYTAEGYDSLVLTKYHRGDGMIVLFGGKLDKKTAPMIAQVIASKLAYDSEILEQHSGAIYRSSITDYMSAITLKSPILYIYVGVPQIYAKTFEY